VESGVVGNPAELIVEGVVTPLAMETGIIDSEIADIVEYFHQNGLEQVERAGAILGSIIVEDIMKLRQIVQEDKVEETTLQCLELLF